jgi:hypothetical protein
MPIESGDQACLAAFADKLGHGPPFSEEELATIESLVVVHARDLSPLEACTGLRHLRVLASEVGNFLFCDMLPELAHLEVLATKVESLNGAVFCGQLRRVDLLYTTVSDAAEVLGISEFRRGTLIGNTWSSSSWSYLQSECPQPGMFVELPTEHDWKLTLLLWEKIQACWGPVAQSQSLLVRPGLPTLTKNVFDALELSSIRHEMNQPGFSAEHLFQEYANRVVAPDLSELAQSRTLGNGDDALEWIAGSSLPDDDKAALGAFVGHFPGVTFYKASEALIQRETKGDKYTLPAWYRTQRATLDGWIPTVASTPIRTAGYELDSSPRADRAGSLSFYLGLYPHASEVEARFLAAGFVNVGMCVEDPEIYLAMRLDGSDRQIYDYHFEDVSDALSEGRDPSTSLYPAFRSYASMLERVVSLLPQGRDPIAAT